MIKGRIISNQDQGQCLLSHVKPGVVCTRPRYQVSVYRAIGPLVLIKAYLLSDVHASENKDGNQHRKRSAFAYMAGD